MFVPQHVQRKVIIQKLAYDKVVASLVLIKFLAHPFSKDSIKITARVIDLF